VRPRNHVRKEHFALFIGLEVDCVIALQFVAESVIDRGEQPLLALKLDVTARRRARLLEVALEDGLRLATRFSSPHERRDDVLRRRPPGGRGLGRRLDAEERASCRWARARCPSSCWANGCRSPTSWAWSRCRPSRSGWATSRCFQSCCRPSRSGSWPRSRCSHSGCRPLRSGTWARSRCSQSGRRPLRNGSWPRSRCSQSGCRTLRSG
jgi:hypothetical protein